MSFEKEIIPTNEETGDELEEKKNSDNIDYPKLHGEITDEYGDFINPRPLEDMEKGNEEGGQSVTARERIEQLKKRGEIEKNENDVLADKMSDDVGERLRPLEDIEKVKND